MAQLLRRDAEHTSADLPQMWQGFVFLQKEVMDPTAFSLASSLILMSWLLLHSLASLTELDAAFPQNIVTPCPPCGKAAVDYKSQTVQFLGVLQQQELIKNTGATMTSF